MAGEEAKFHQAAGLIFIQIDAFEDGGLAALEFRQVACVGFRRPSLETRLHYQNSVLWDSLRVNSFKCIYYASQLHLGLS
jgi:hypothetical protein